MINENSHHCGMQVWLETHLHVGIVAKEVLIINWSLIVISLASMCLIFSSKFAKNALSKQKKTKTQINELIRRNTKQLFYLLTAGTTSSMSRKISSRSRRSDGGELVILRLFIVVTRNTSDICRSLAEIHKHILHKMLFCFESNICTM